MIDLTSFSKRLEEARARSAMDTRRGLPVEAVVNRTWEELEQTWEELAVAQEELRQQNEELGVANQAVEAERQRYVSLFDFAPDGYLVTDAVGLVQEVNHAALALLGTSRTVLVGKPLALFIPTERRREFRRVVNRLGTAGKVREWDLDIQPRQGPVFPVTAAVASIPRPHGVELRWLLRDATERRRLESELRVAYDEMEERVATRTADLEKANRALAEALSREQTLRAQAESADQAKDSFLAMLSHELRTPMTALVGWVHLLRHSRLDGETYQRALESVERSTQAQVKLVNDILDVSRIITGKLQLEKDVLDLVPLVANAVNVMRPMAAQKGLTLDYREAVNSALLLGDPERLQQVVWNLLSNAIKFTPERGRIAVTVSGDGDGVSVTVEDNGIGIEAEFLPRVFERFLQADGSTTRTHGGLGLGLAIARHLVEQHGGRIEARSGGRGQGSSFSFRLPLAPADDLAAPATDDTKRVPRVRVLLVEDDRDTREMLETVLHSYGIDLIAVDSVAAAMDALRRTLPDMIVSDIGLPGEDGFSLVRQLRALPPEEGGLTPAVAFSGYLLPDTRRRVLDAGFQELLQKPILPEELAQVVRELARRKTEP